MPRRLFRRDDRGVTEVLGFVLMFALSSIVLITSVQAFNEAKTNADGVVSGVELRGVANRVSTRVVQAALLSEDFPNASIRVEMRIPEAIGTGPYWVETASSGGNTVIEAESADGSYSATASVFNVDKIVSEIAAGRMYSGNASLAVVASPVDRHWNFTDGDSPSSIIRLKGVDE